MKEDFVLLKRLEARLGSVGQWLQKTPEGDPRFKELGRWSRWRKNPDRRKSGFEPLEPHIELLELAARVGVFDRGRERIRGKALRSCCG